MGTPTVIGKPRGHKDNDENMQSELKVVLQILAILAALMPQDELHCFNDEHDKAEYHENSCFETCQTSFHVVSMVRR